MGSQLPERQVAAQHRHARFAKRVRQRPQQRRLAVCPRAVGQHQSVTRRCFRNMKKSPYRDFAWTLVNECSHFRKTLRPTKTPRNVILSERAILARESKSLSRAKSRGPLTLTKISRNCHPERGRAFLRPSRGTPTSHEQPLVVSQTHPRSTSSPASPRFILFVSLSAAGRLCTAIDQRTSTIDHGLPGGPHARR